MKSQDSWREWNREKWEGKNRFMYRESGGRNYWPWHARSLDPDIGRTLDEYGIRGGKLLDLGTCSGSQAIALAKLGFEVTGTDVSETALGNARAKLAEEHGDIRVEFVLDDILDTRLAADRFDVVLDRGCFHSLYHFGRDRYVLNILRVLGPRGMVLLKTMSAKEERFRRHDTFGDVQFPMPQHFDPDLLRSSFKDFFTIHDIRDSFFYTSHLARPAQAHLTILSRLPEGE